MPKIVFLPLGKTVELKSGETLFKAARVNGVPLGSSCRGDGICGWCRVEIVSGNENLSRPEKAELKLRDSAGFLENERLACGTRVYGDVVITTGYW